MLINAATSKGMRTVLTETEATMFVVVVEQEEVLKVRAGGILATGERAWWAAPCRLGR